VEEQSAALVGLKFLHDIGSMLDSDLPDPAAKADDKTEGRMVPVSAMLVERKAKKEALALLEQALEKISKQDALLLKLEGENSELESRAAHLRARLANVEAGRPAFAGMGLLDAILNRGSPDAGPDAAQLKVPVGAEDTGPGRRQPS
jgi:hypothetical protein